MYVVNAAEMRAIDRYTIDMLGIPGLVLMENAGREAARMIQQSYPVPCNWLILVGKGNNGGDGLVVARHLFEAGYEIHIVFAEPPERLQGEAAIQRDIVTKLGIPWSVYERETIHWHTFDGIVDALLGTGSKDAPRGSYAAMIREANRSGLPIVAIDIPSGLDADTGKVYDPCIQAVQTAALAFLKRGLVQYPGKQWAGKIEVVPIGIPDVVAKTFALQTFLLNADFLKKRMQIASLVARQPSTHKGSYGHALMIAGSQGMSGAGLLCAGGALRSGCGLLTWALPEALARQMTGHLPEAMLVGAPDDGSGNWTEGARDTLLAVSIGKTSIGIGPGIGQFPGGQQLLKDIWESVGGPLVIDADGLNLLARDFKQLPKRNSSTVLTPHPGEMARLAQLPIQAIQENRILIARTFAVEHQVTLILKGAHTLIATPEGEVFVNPTGNPGMATGGTGDILAGLVTGLLAQGLNATQAACIGAYIHGYAGDLAAHEKGMNSLLAGDILDKIGQAFQVFA
ncbi:NAD(P)H-hydrate dehydratase [Fodinisporobacter ferrooxydans]|uniref:Bifunctional NAD(P)H-hydrate repair enzyme n=1 Tax=Fodinisporobacter ferrooxydans TaxID=2901836 RepID=A0ABY4CLC5_9BACL|nr:NAD(P)H-hydrate dehydratase [Alicyclobacillaceae bacterium MYW30-H2]